MLNSGMYPHQVLIRFPMNPVFDVLLTYPCYFIFSEYLEGKPSEYGNAVYISNSACLQIDFLLTNISVYIHFQCYSVKFLLYVDCT